MQINLTGFLNGRNARLFMDELWNLLLNAQASESGIPDSFVQQKKEEIKKRLVSKFTIHFLFYILNSFEYSGRRGEGKRSWWKRASEGS